MWQINSTSSKLQKEFVVMGTLNGFNLLDCSMTWGKLCSFGGRVKMVKMDIRPTENSVPWDGTLLLWAVGFLAMPSSFLNSTASIPTCTTLATIRCGVYEPHCGLDKISWAWGHDEYMYRMLVANGTCVPREGLDVIRYHSAHPLQDKGAYRHLLKPEDKGQLESIRLFNRFDLYAKHENNDIREKIDDLWPYYKGLLEKFDLGRSLNW
jgi:hypothetical protein